MNSKTGTGDRLKHFRQINNLTQEELAEASRVSIRTIQRIENGESTGSAYTLRALALALNIESKELSVSLTETTINDNSTSNLKMLNLSSLSLLIIPLGNIILPAIIFSKYRNEEAVQTYGKKILSFQVLWTISTLVLVFLLPVLLFLLFPTIRGSSVPLSIPVYFALAFVNIYFTMRFAFEINHQPRVLNKIPNIL